MSSVRWGNQPGDGPIPMWRTTLELAEAHRYTERPSWASWRGTKCHEVGASGLRTCLSGPPAARPGRSYATMADQFKVSTEAARQHLLAAGMALRLPGRAQLDPLLTWSDITGWQPQGRSA